MSDVDWDLWRFVWGVAVTVITAGLGVWAWLTRKHSVNRSAIEKVEAGAKERDQQRQTDISRHERRITILEENLKHLPSASDIKDLRESISQLNSLVSNQQATTKGLGRSVARIEQYLLERPDK